MSNLKVGDSIVYYCTTDMRHKKGAVTAVDVEVKWLWEWHEKGTVFYSERKRQGAKHPLGIEINGSLTRPYGVNAKEVML